MRKGSITFWLGVVVFLAIVLVMTQTVRNEYPFFAGYVILQFVVLSVAWTILGGYAGYVNFGTNAFFGVDRKSTRLNSSHRIASRMPSSA